MPGMGTPLRPACVTCVSTCHVRAHGQRAREEQGRTSRPPHPLHPLHRSTRVDSSNDKQRRQHHTKPAAATKQIKKKKRKEKERDLCAGLDA
eukprot:1721378-Rhodomonas_salina.1